MSIYTGSTYDKQTINRLLNEAQNAYHALITGTKAVKVEREGRMVEYNKTNKEDLRLYIADLQGMISSTTSRGRRPARVQF